MSTSTHEFLKYVDHDIIRELLECDVDELERRARDVEHKLSLVEARSIDEHAKECENLIALKRDVDESERMLLAMERELGAFADDLGNISSEIRELQTQSEILRVRGTNRARAERALGKMIESLTVDPSLIQTLVNGYAGDEAFSRRATELAQKLDVIDKLRRPSAHDAGGVVVLAASDVAPELERLRVKTCEKSWAFLYGQFYALKKPRTNVQLIQENTLAKYEPLVAFLRTRGPEVYWEVKSTYVDVMGKLLKTALATYVESLKRLAAPPKAYIALGSKTRALGGTNDIAGMSTLSGIFGSSASALTSTEDAGEHDELFSLRNRAQTLQDAESAPPLVVHRPSDKVQQELREYEELFRSAHRLLIDTATFEYAFCEQFWRGDKDMFEKVFAGPMMVYNDFFAQGVASASKDAVGLLIAIRVNAVNRRVMSRRRVPALDAYFDNLNMTLWPKFKYACDEHVKSLEHMKDSFEPNPEAPSFIVRRYANFVLALTTVAHASFESSTVVDDEEVNIATQVDLVLDRLRRAAFDCVSTKLCASLRQSPKRQSAYLVKTFNFVCTTLSSVSNIKDVQVNPSTELATLQFFEEKYAEESLAFVGHVMRERFAAIDTLDCNASFDVTLEALTAFQRNWCQSLANTYADCVACFGAPDWRAVELFRRCVTELIARYGRVVDGGFASRFNEEQATALEECVVTKPTFTLESNRYTSKSSERLASQ